LNLCYGSTSYSNLTFWLGYIKSLSFSSYQKGTEQRTPSFVVQRLTVTLYYGSKN
jgi:hypothetical protein